MKKTRLLLVIMTFSIISLATFAQSQSTSIKSKDIVIVVDEFEIVGEENLQDPIFANEIALKSIRETFEAALVNQKYENITIITQIYLERIKKYNKDIESNIPKADFIVVAKLSILSDISGKFSAAILDISNGKIVASVNNEPKDIDYYENIEFMVKEAAKDLMSTFIRTDYYKNRKYNN